MTSIVLIFKAHIDLHQPQRPLDISGSREDALSIICLLLGSDQEPLWKWYDLAIVFQEVQSLCSSRYYVTASNQLKPSDEMLINKTCKK